MDIERIRDKETDIAIIVRREHVPSSDIEFITPGNFTQQVGMHKCKAGKTISSHLHKSIKRNIVGTSEAIFIRSGKVEVDLHNDSMEHIVTKTLNPGDFIFLISGGHGFRIMEDSIMLEVKQGPYAGEEDKIRF